MSISTVVRAPSKSYSKHDICGICRVVLHPLLEHKLGDIVIHKDSNGAKHPMHADCLKTALATDPRFRIDRTGNCPICRDRIAWPKLRDSLSHKIVAVAVVIIMSAAMHAIFSYLTGRPLVAAITPSITLSLRSINALWLEHKEIGLERSLAVEAGINLATSTAMIGIPLLASMAASEITESVIPNSLITATLGTIGLIPFMTRFLEGNLLSK